MEGAAVVVDDADNQDDVLNLPPGFRFHPTDEEIITHYLSQKVLDTNFTATAIGEVDLNKCEPWDLPKKAKMREKEWFFFSHKGRKYPTGMRANRATEAGYWKATGKDKEIYSKGKDRHRQLIGMKKTLVFYKGRAPKGEKSNWVMHEFRLEGKFSSYNLPKSPKDEWVVCRVVHKNTGTIRASPTSDFTSINSFVEDLLAPSSLPPLTDSPYFNNNERPNDSTYAKISGTDTEDDFKGTVLVNPSMNNHQLQMQPQNYTFIPTTYYQTAPSANYQVPNSILYQNAIRSSTLGYSRQQQSIVNSIPNIWGSANSMQTANQALERQLKVEQFSSNQSIVSRSQDTGLSTDMTTEISSKKEVDEGNRYEDLDSLWSY